MVQDKNDTGTTMYSKKNLYRLMISQLYYDGFFDAAKEVANVIGPHEPCSPSDRLMAIVSQSHQIGPSNENNLLDDHSCALDLDYHAESSTLAPEPATYETAYITTHMQPCRAGCFSTDGQLVATGSVDTSIKVLAVERMLSVSGGMEPRQEQPSHPVIRTLYDHMDEVSCLEFHPKNQILASGSRDRTVKLFDISKAAVKKAYKELSDSVAIRCLAFHPTGDSMAVGTDHQVLRVYDLQTARCFVSATVPSKQHQSAITSVRYNGACTMYATGSLDGSIKLWDAVSSRCINTFPAAHNGAEVSSIAFSKNGKYLLSSGKNSSVRLWELTMNRCLIEYPVAGPSLEQQYGAQAIFNHTEDYVLFPDEATNTLCAWHSRNASRCHLMPLQHKALVRHIVHSPTNSAFLSCSDDFRARYWVKRTETH